MKINPAKHTVCEKGHMYRHKKHDSCPVCLNNQRQQEARKPIKKAIELNVSESLPTHYCGKMLYSKDTAKERVRKSRGQLQGFYYCEQCDAYHVTKQSQEPERVQWFKDHPKQFRNKHV